MGTSEFYMFSRILVAGGKISRVEFIQFLYVKFIWTEEIRNQLREEGKDWREGSSYGKIFAFTSVLFHSIPYIYGRE